MADPNDNLKELLSKLALTNNSSKSIADHKFWSTQPVPSLDEQVEQDGPITPNTPKAQLKQEPYTLPEGYEWCTIDVTDSEEMKGVYQLLCLNYVEDDDASFRFNYKPEFLAWGLMPPGYNSDLHIGVRVTASKKLVGFISAIPAQIRVREQFVAFLILQQAASSRDQFSVCSQKAQTKEIGSCAYQGSHSASEFDWNLSGSLYCWNIPS